ncbi:nitrous oxide-stimulated promoter family protein [Pseudobacteroides sp.]|uniref:nitrous oxide-stimulated promoter family protein n=1 Tax=Pseudobacteroides sp. TaxID=1968840 RepID=UPI0039C8C29B
MKNDIFILVKFIDTFCKHHHSNKAKSLFSSHQFEPKEEFLMCKECIELALYSIQRRSNCIHNGKISCKNCTIKCFKDEYRNQIRKVMKFSGIYFIKKGRLDYLIKYFF